MQNFENAVDKALNMFGPDILENKYVFLNVIEDLVPYLENDYKFVKKLFDSDLGRLLKDAYISDGFKNQYYEDILQYLLHEVGLSETKAFQFMGYFSFLISNQNQKIEIVTNVDDEITEKKDSNITVNYEAILENVEEDIERNIRQGNLSEAIKIFNDSEQLLMFSDYYDSICLMIGEELEDNEPSKAVSYYNKAANKGNARAQFLLGYMYENGDGVVKDINRAMLWYKSAAEAGNRGAQHNLGCFYYFGNVVSQDYKIAYEYFYEAAMQGKADSMKNIGVMYEIGQYVKQDYEKALFWYDKARCSGDIDAGNYYRNLEKKVQKRSLRKRVLFRVLNKDADKKDLYFNIGEEILGRSFSEHLQAEPVLKLLYNSTTNEIGIKNLSSFDWIIVKTNNNYLPCQPNKIVPIEQGDMIRIINRVVQLNVLKIEREN